jgi:tetratricopeptide (TPR) repeat protein
MSESDREEAGRLFREAYEHQMSGRLDQAIELYRRSIEAHPTAEAHTFLGWTYSFLGRYDDAIEECRRAIEVDPEFGNPYNDIGAYLIELGRHDEAIPWLEKAIEAPRYEPRHFPHFNLARVYIHRWEWDRAVPLLEKALALEPGYTLAQRELSRIVARMN